jgi:hypothetical protein
MRINFLFLLPFLFFLQACGSGKLATENKQLKTRVADLEYQIYEITESPDQLARDILQDVELLMTIPYRDNLELAITMIQTYKATYPKNKYISELSDKEKELQSILDTAFNQDFIGFDKNASSNQNTEQATSDNKIQFSVQVNERTNGFVNVQLSAQNLNNKSLTNVWLKATLVDKNGGSYGITQDFFFNRLNPYDLKTETLSWEYVQHDEISGIVLKQLRYSENRQTKMLEEHECIVGQGNVKIFLEF